jgi:ribonuclease G
MAKELIISANVHEKKVAMLEDGVVTEFYVERRDENQGVVGNLYKGRVMKVLPGMQSAFVDIGLERDAFLYVSDFTEFMEEEGEVDFREVSEESRPPRVDDRSRRGDRPRHEHHPAGPRPVPGPEAVSEDRGEREDREPEVAAERPVRIEDAVEQLAEIADESVIPPPPKEEDLPELESLNEQIAAAETVPIERITDDEIAEEAKVEPEEVVAVKAEATEEEKPRRGRGRKPIERKKVTKEEKPAKSSSKKTAAKPSRKSSKRRGEEEESADPEAPQFQRVTDEDIRQDAGELLKDAIVQEKIIEQVHSAEFQTTTSFQPEPEPEWRVGSLRSLNEGGAAFQRVVDETSDAPRKVETAAVGEYEPQSALDAEPAASPFRHISDVVRGVYGQIPSDEQSEQSAEYDSQKLEASASESDEPSVDSSTDQVIESFPEEDRDAEIRDRGFREEFAVRRGGRGRRGRGGRREPQQQANVENVDEQETPAEAAPIEESVVPVEEAPHEESHPVELQQAEARPADSRGGDQRPIENRQNDPRQMGPRHQGPRPPRRPDNRRPDRRPDQRPAGGADAQQRRPEYGAARRPERTGAPTISELLHEGQEILVQIAKEPIAKKGARITSHIALPGRFIVYMPTVNHIGVSRKIPNEVERIRLKRIVTGLRDREGAAGGFIARTACAGHTEQELADDMRYLLRTWADIRKKAERGKAPALVHRDLDLVQRILRDQMSEEFTAIRIDNEVEYARIVEFVNRVQPKLVKRVKLYTGDQPILEKFGVQAEIDKAVRPRVWLRSGGYIVINQTEALVAIDVNTGKFVGKSDKLEDTITRTNLEAAKEIVRQVRLRDLGGIIVLDLIDMEERKNRQKVMMALQQELSRDRSPSKILSINDFGLVAITRKRVKQSLERTLCTPCPYCQGAGMVKSAQTMCFEILEQAKAMSKQLAGASDVMLRVSPHVAESLRSTEREVMEEIEAHFGNPVTIEPDPNLHQEQFDFAVM